MLIRLPLHSKHDPSLRLLQCSNSPASLSLLKSPLSTIPVASSFVKFAILHAAVRMILRPTIPPCLVDSSACFNWYKQFTASPQVIDQRPILDPPIPLSNALSSTHTPTAIASSCLQCCLNSLSL
eukprot:GFKZ01015527.1.p1 GENE.GFKZ01015527.1~~GFKZ01015527.1.p1  ORF type:complete len:125 (-),score=1.25 GFKZ01015527.1:518-892(-)